jgi:hypothetical protein
MDYFTQRLTELRKEIANLRSNNASYSRQSEHSQIEQSGYELRGNRLLQIKSELTAMLSQPRQGSVWWERSRGGVQP